MNCQLSYRKELFVIHYSHSLWNWESSLGSFWFCSYWIVDLVNCFNVGLNFSWMFYWILVVICNDQIFWNTYTSFLLIISIVSKICLTSLISGVNFCQIWFIFMIDWQRRAVHWTNKIDMIQYLESKMQYVGSWCLFCLYIKATFTAKNHKIKCI